MTMQKLLLFAKNCQELTIKWKSCVTLKPFTRHVIKKLLKDLKAPLLFSVDVGHKKILQETW